MRSTAARRDRGVACSIQQNGHTSKEKPPRSPIAGPRGGFLSQKTAGVLDMQEVDSSSLFVPTRKEEIEAQVIGFFFYEVETDVRVNTHCGIYL